MYAVLHQQAEVDTIFQNLNTILSLVLYVFSAHIQNLEKHKIDPYAPL